MNAKCIKSKLTAAFSLIELMVVIGIVALLTAIAVPSYQGYLQQSKVTEIFSLASEQMNQWTQRHNLGSAFDVINEDGLGTFIGATELVDVTTSPTVVTDCPNDGDLGVVCIELNAAAGTGIDPSLANLVIYFTPEETEAPVNDSANVNITWDCNFVSSDDEDTDATITSLLAPGSCTAG